MAQKTGNRRSGKGAQASHITQSNKGLPVLEESNLEFSLSANRVQILTPKPKLTR